MGGLSYFVLLKLFLSTLQLPGRCTHSHSWNTIQMLKIPRILVLASISPLTFRLTSDFYSLISHTHNSDCPKLSSQFSFSLLISVFLEYGTIIYPVAQARNLGIIQVLSLFLNRTSNLFVSHVESTSNIFLLHSSLPTPVDMTPGLSY